jgi:hypothetical protein
MVKGHRVKREPEQPWSLPALVFRNMLPTEALVALAREQDGLYRSVVHVAPEASLVTMHRLGEGRFRVSVTSDAGGAMRAGEAESAQLEWALRYAYTELLRDTLRHSESAASLSARAA